jgi:hypothetical protein
MPMTEPTNMDDEPWKIRSPEIRYMPMQAGRRLRLFFRKAAVELTFRGSRRTSSSRRRLIPRARARRPPTAEVAEAWHYMEAWPILDGPAAMSAPKEGLSPGAWYRVVEDGGKTWVVLDVHHVEVRVPKDDVDVSASAPKTWVWCTTRISSARAATNAATSGDKPKEVKCAGAGNTYAVDWSDKA